VSVAWAEEDGKEIQDIERFDELQEEHKEISRSGAGKKFGKDASKEAVKLHTATHLLHTALREVLGEEVKQMGSDINDQRLRFDFSFDRKLEQQEIEKIESLVNRKIEEDLGVKKEEMSIKDALESGALAFFKEKYPDKVNVYSIGDFSKEICAGPHVGKTGEIGRFQILKEKSSSAGIRRIKAIVK